jgi:alginate O-acetyltransferase complex protein AlgI
MLFNSLDFAIFLPTVFIIYWFVFDNKYRYQNILIVLASYIFYGWWDWRFLSLIILSTIVDFFVGIGLGKEQSRRRRKSLLWISVIVNIGILGFFKYFNFFLDNVSTAFEIFGMSIQSGSLSIVLPVGISFYTFQTLSYSIDVYNRKLLPTRDYFAFSAFVSFFPQLVAGPIERATNLLPQFYTKRVFDYSKSVDGMRQILWGFFKKIVIADNCAVYANQIFNNSDNMNSSALLLGAFFFAFQIYGDFSGYSDIAIGTSRLFGFDLRQNFAFPYFSRDIAEFWRRWHISLSSWFRDYIYIPLGGSKGSLESKVRNVFIIFVVSGLWHGANWTFIVWGTINAIYFLPLLLLKQNRINIGVVADGRVLPGVKEIFQMSLTFILTVFAWIFFRAENISHALSYIYDIISSSPFQIPNIADPLGALKSIIFVIIFFAIEWVGRSHRYAIECLGFNWTRSLRYALYYAIITVIIVYGGAEQQFIYFQF